MESDFLLPLPPEADNLRLQAPGYTRRTLTPDYKRWREQADIALFWQRRTIERNTSNTMIIVFSFGENVHYPISSRLIVFEAALLSYLASRKIIKNDASHNVTSRFSSYDADENMLRVVIKHKQADVYY